jgi:peptidoglycan/LPS O-acetylase OafA/YrhL
MCYSLYLVHFPLIVFLGWIAALARLQPSPLVSIPVCGALAIAASWPFHVHVERRFLNTPVVDRLRAEPAVAQAV